MTASHAKLRRKRVMASALLMAAKPVIGGQAVIEGVMMRSPKSFAVAVRKPDGAIAIREEAWLSFSERLPFLKLPILRGVLLSPDDELRRHVILELMCNFHLDMRAVEQRFGIDFAAYFAHELERLRDDEANGFVVVTPDAIDVSPLGRVFIRNLCMVFDKYLRADTDKPVFSRTI